MTKNFALIGAAGYIAPKHMQAIKDSGHKLVAAFDPADSVGILDRYFDDVDFFTEFERFDRHIEKLRRQDEGKQADYVSICSPNYLHDAHIRFALRTKAGAICEKPLVLNPWNLDALEEIEKEEGKRVYNILQLRVHPAIKELKQKIQDKTRNLEPGTRNSRPAFATRDLRCAPTSKHPPLSPLPERDSLRSKGGIPVVNPEPGNQHSGKKALIDLTYITSRGKWYFYSWKGNMEKSGGVATNIGIHFFDMLIWVFGKVEHSEVHLAEPKKMAGFIELENANVRWFLSLDKNDLPESALKENKPTFRSITVDGREIEFSGGFTDLHTVVYKDILEGRGYGIADTRPSIELAHQIRHDKPVGVKGDHVHPILKTKVKK